MGRLCAGAVLVLAITGVASLSPPRTTRTPFHQLLHKTVSGAAPDTLNVVFSPYSVATALTMLREASVGSGHQEIADVLGRGHRMARQANVEQHGVTLKLWDAFYYDKSIDVEYDYERSMQRLGASVLPQPFADQPEEAVAAINAEVSRETLGMVRRLLSDADPSTLAMLVSAVYFRAEWRTAFDTSRTRPGTFTTADGRRERVSMMTGEGQYSYLRSEEDAFTSVAIPYKEDRFQMILVLPDKNADINDVISRFDVDLMYKEMRTQRTIVKFPKFRVQSKLPLADILKKLGIQEVFTRHADLANMSPDPRLYVSSARHTATIETDEAGSEAAAATSAGISARSFFTPPTPSLIANRPFLFFVYDVDTANVLFSGQIQDAAEAQFAQSTPAPEPESRPDLEPVVELTPEPEPVLDLALDRELLLEPDSSVETLDEPGLQDSLQEVLGRQTAGRGGGRGGRAGGAGRGGRGGRNRGRGRAQAPIAQTALSGPSGASGPSATGASASGPTATGPSGTAPTGGFQRPAGQRRANQRRRVGGGGRGNFPRRRVNRRQRVQPAYQPPPPPPPPLPPPPPRRRRPPPPRRRPPPPQRPYRPPPPPRPYRPPPRPRPRRPPPPRRAPRPQPPLALPGSRYNPACNCHEPPIYPTAPLPTVRDTRVVNINIHKTQTPIAPIVPVADLWQSTPTASIWGATDPLLWGSTTNLWPNSFWHNPLATSGLLVP